MCDPLSIGTLAAGTGLSLLGGNAAKSQQVSQMAAAQNAANAVLDKHLAKQQGFSDQNRGIADAATAYFDPTAQAAAQDANSQKREALLLGNITDTSGQMPEVGSGAYAGGTDLVKKTNADRLKTAFDLATNKAKANAKLGSYADTWQGNDENITDAARREGTVNKLSAMDASLISPEQTLAQYSAYQIPSVWPGVAQSVGGLLGGLAGSGLIKKWTP